MARKLALVLAALAIVSVANAALNTNSPNANSFNSSGLTQYINSSDTTWYNKATILASSVMWGPGSDNTTFYTYAPNYDSTTKTVTVNRKKANTTSYATITDDTISGGSTCDSSTIKYAAGTAAFGYACQLTSTAGSTPKDLWLSYANSGAATFTKIQLTAEASTNGYVPEGLWYDEGTQYWHVVFRQEDNTSPANILGLYTQAVNTTNGTSALLYAAGGVSLATWSSIASTAVTVGSVGGNNLTNAATGSVVIKDSSVSATKVVKVFTVTLSSGSGTATTLATDTVTTDDPAIATTYSPVGQFSSYSTTGVGVLQVITSTPSGGSASTTGQTLFVYLNNTPTNNYNYTLATTVASAKISGTNFGEGYSIISTQTTTGTGSVISYQNFFSNGTVNASSTATSLGTYTGQTGIWLDTNGALWFAVANYDSAGDGGANPPILANSVLVASVGYIFSQVFSFASTLSSVFAFVALMIAAVFAF